MAYSPATVTKGRGQGIAVYTGMSTIIGGIAASMQGKNRKQNRSLSRKKHGPVQPVRGSTLRAWDSIGKFLDLTQGSLLQIKMRKLEYFLFGCALLLAIIVFGVNRLNVTNEVAVYAISTGIAIIPESLVAVLTIAVMVGMTQMRERKVVVRQLSALEALGGVTDFGSDKTGTLTQGNIVDRKAWIPGVAIYSVRRELERSKQPQCWDYYPWTRPSIKESCRRAGKSQSRRLIKSQAQLDLLLLYWRRSWREVNTEPKVVGSMRRWKSRKIQPCDLNWNHSSNRQLFVILQQYVR